MNKILAFILIICFAGCKNNDHKDHMLIISLNQGLENSSVIIAGASNKVYKLMYDKLYNPFQTYYTRRWYPGAMLVKKYTDSVIIYVDSLKAILKNQSGFDQHKDEQAVMDNTNASEIIFYKKNQQAVLKKHIENYKDSVLSIDTEASAGLKNEIDSLIGFSDTSAGQRSYWNSLFKNKAAIEALVILNKFENNIRCIENKLVDYFYMRIGVVGPDHEKIVSIIKQSSNILKPGDVLEINAGLGFYSSVPGPEVFINGKTITLDNNYMAIYKIKVPLQPGEYRVPVKIKYYTPDGTKTTEAQIIKYTVFDTTKH